jgi:hypothetical protein
MSLFEQITGMLGGLQQTREQVQRYEQGHANFDDPRSPDVQNWNQMIGAAPADVQQDVFARAAQQINPQHYEEHVTPGMGGTDPLGGLDRGQLAMLAASLLNAYSSRHGGQGGLGQLIQMIPGLQTTDPRQMDPNQVAVLANWMRQNHPNSFGQAATQVAQQQPSLLQQLLGNKALMLAAATLGAKILSDRARARAGR